MADRLPKATLVVDPRFPGGTSTAVASEIEVLSQLCRLRVAAISSRMFSGKAAHRAIESACEEAGIEIQWDPGTISDEIVILHNPSFLKFETTLGSRIVADRLFVICHENFIRPTGGESFAVGHCIDLISQASLCRRKFLTPISAWNRSTVTRWIEAAGGVAGWEISPIDWTNICSFEFRPPTTTPRDRRGRHSRPGFEKFPDMGTLATLYPETCDSVRILGADSLLEEEAPDSWDLIPFMGEDVAAFLETIDFFVYFTNPCCRESFGRAIGEAIAAGKLVITDPGTATTFGDGVIGATPAEVDAIVRRHVRQPDLYVERVTRAQRDLDGFSATNFSNRFLDLLETTSRRAAPTQSRVEELYALV